jgi:trans-aconitate 2-methyltransferase
MPTTTIPARANHTVLDIVFMSLRLSVVYLERLNVLQMSRYTYGDSALAAERLGLVARMFEPTTRAFLATAAPEASPLAVDLGCGPGYTTRLLHATTGARATVGLDRSAAFVALAGRDEPEGVSFAVHDVTRVPFPTGPADVVYARLLLAHLTGVEEVVHRWSTILTIGGRLLADDLESLDAPEPAFRTYLDEVAIAVVRAEGGDLFVGPRLHRMLDPPGCARVHDALASFSPPASLTARVFGMNLAVLVERGETPPRPDLASALEAIASGARDARPATWRVRQLAWRRDEG